MRRLNCFARLTCVLTFLWGAPTFAADGALEINQACALNGGCFSGDTAGFPVSIDGSAGRSYVLTSDLQVADENTTAILVESNDITLDLNGFSILGVTACSGIPVKSCSPTGSGIGVEDRVLHPASQRTTVQNGSIVGMGSSGLSLQAQNRVLNVHTSHNGFRGISAGLGSTVTGNTARLNGDLGIWANSGSVVSGNAVYGNKTDGIKASNGRVSGNSAQANGGYGLQLLGNAGYDHNTIDDNGVGTVLGGVNAGGNVCNGSTTCP